MSVEVTALTRRYGATTALDQVDLRIQPGEFIALLGPSGSGKTTLLRCLAGLDFPDHGSIRIDGRDMDGVPARARGIGFVFQNYALFRHMSVFDNIAFGLTVRPRPDRAAIAARVRELLRLVQIPELERRMPDQLSGGQRQRVALARALAIEPPLLLLDEPFGALDAAVRKDLRRWLRGLQESLGLTTVLVTHDQDEAMELADRIAVMRAGRIEQIDTPPTLLEAPATAFVAGFLGEAAAVPCVVDAGTASLGIPAPGVPDGPATAFLRPVQVVVGDAGMPATLVGWRDDGRGLRLFLRLGGVDLEGVPAPGWRPRARGQECGLVIEGGRVFR